MELRMRRIRHFATRLFEPFPDAQSPAAALLGSEVRWAIFAGRRSTKLEYVALQFINADLCLSLIRSLQERLIDGLRAFRGINGEL